MAATPDGFDSRRPTPNGPADEEERTYERDEHLTSEASGHHAGYRERIRENVCE